MGPTLRPLTAADAPVVLAINEASVHHLAPLDGDEYQWFLEVAAVAWGVELDGELAGFVFVLDPGVDYASRNYAWFSEHYERFAYLDRVAIDERARRRGVGTAIYDAVEARAAEQGVPLLLEVNIEPPNHPSLAFHASRGFAEVGTLAHDGGAKVVRLLAKG
ncbi:GNAT family N-acetyltransferase [Aquihabitans daechungensis]|uniref:GNAT family N-acetyltransferase n=1 Tax=Aquihabitans daechungensis TaxID=1052257 RepID=UPI003BA34AB3